MNPIHKKKCKKTEKPISKAMVWNSLFKLYHLIEQNRTQNDYVKTDEIENVMKYRELCLKLKDFSIGCRMCQPTTSSVGMKFGTRHIHVKPLGIYSNNLGGDVYNTLFICDECGRPGIERCEDIRYPFYSIL